MACTWWNWPALRLVLGLLMVFGLGYLVNWMVTPEEARAAKAQLAELDRDVELIDLVGGRLRLAEIRLRFLVLGEPRVRHPPVNAVQRFFRRQLHRVVEGGQKCCRGDG